MVYRKMAAVYNRLMDNVPYDDWVVMIQQMIAQTERPVQSIIDLGCGTGVITRKLAAGGYTMTGVDQSGDMLHEAQKDLEPAGGISWLEADMTKLDGVEQRYDMAISCCDVINYVTDLQAVEQAFKNVYQLLEPDGIFFFDVHSMHTVEDIYIGQTFSDVMEEAAYIWECIPGEEKGEMYHHVTFFHQEEEDRFIRFQEEHHQRTFPIEVYKNILKNIGFKKIHIYADFSLEADNWDEQSERIFFLAEK
ncbi:class I SAM-dependent DNA methyltransferase [Oceanobacillus oncorhynchi]|uniref:class I SAM-dependent DNA methyltransferase n=1 Tax=Oceanobacillus oncorhynchi TaxID=545501 RepID=UPI002116C228|nr:class I SAM-dependent methyltransferase [Oceanobacillus oncorhynchi]UUI38521.1 class I SAM-dependent methyltransferase [Oceanobacillus oncorhynchi]